MEKSYLESAKKQFEYYKLLGDRSFAQLDDAQLFWKSDAEANSIAIIVQHLWGNMLSRWTDFFTSDGEKEWRNREGEFESTISTRSELIEKWEAGWDCLFAALASINKENFHQTVYIRNMGHTIVEAINRQLAHYAYHVGQIVFLGRMQKGMDWTSLSIPRGQSNIYNKEKFAQPKRQAHFTDEYLGKSKDSQS